MPSKLRKAIEAVKDQTSISLAKVSNNHYTNLEVAVLKATTHDNVPIDERYVYEVLHMVSIDKIYAAACAKAIGKRISRTRNWIVALKSLMLVLRIFQDGDPYFPREVLHAMKKGAKILNLSNFRDDSNSSPWDYTAFVRTFALYLDERLDCFLTGKLQRRYTNADKRRVERGHHRRANDSIGDMKPSVLIDRIAFWQRLLERTIATRPTGAALDNRLIQISLYAVVQESFHLYKDISDGLTLLVDCFFHLRYEDCVDAFETCLKATRQFEELNKFYSLCKSIGVGRDSEYPSLTTISEELMETLQEFLKDQSSFPSVSKSPIRQALPPLPHSNSTARESYRGHYDSLENPRRAAKLGSKRTSLEDLISATENRTSHGISIDLEDYPDHFKEQSNRDEAFRMSKCASTHSLPVSNPMVDLICLDDWPVPEQETKDDWKEESNAPTGWELVLAEAIQLPSTQSETNAPHTFTSYANQSANTFNAFPGSEHIPTFNAFPEQEHKRQQTKAGDGWELVLAETATQPAQPAFDLNNLYDTKVPSVSNTFHGFPEQMPFSTENFYNQSMTLPMVSLDNHYNRPTQMPPRQYNPFLEVSSELAIVPVETNSSATGFETSFPADKYISAPTIFQATPTFFAHNPDNGTATYGNDRFGAITSASGCMSDSYVALARAQVFDDGSRNQQNLMQEQQLWMQQQNRS